MKQALALYGTLLLLAGYPAVYGQDSGRHLAHQRLAVGVSFARYNGRRTVCLAVEVQ